MELTIETLKALLADRVEGGVLTSGCHDAPNGECHACVRELRSLALGLPWSDHPDGDASPTDRLCQGLNDAGWSSDAVRTEACLPLALLSEETAPVGWTARYVERLIREIIPLALRAVASVCPNEAHRDALEGTAGRCEQEGSAAAATAAATANANANAAYYAAARGAWADAAAATVATADAAYAVAAAAAAAVLFAVAADAAAAWAAANANANAAYYTASAAARAADAAADAAWAAANAAAGDDVLQRSVQILIEVHADESVS